MGNISVPILTFDEDHRFINGETIEVLSDNRLPDGLDENRVYYMIVGGSLNDDQIKIAVSPNDEASVRKLLKSIVLVELFP